MSHKAITFSAETSVRRPTARQGKRTVIISALVFFAAIAVVAWFGISGFQESDESPQVAAPQVIYAGGSPTQAAQESTAPEGQDVAASEDEYIVGEYGEPVTELYADEGVGGGGWGESAIELLDTSTEGDSGRQRD